MSYTKLIVHDDYPNWFLNAWSYCTTMPAKPDDSPRYFQRWNRAFGNRISEIIDGYLLEFDSEADAVAFILTWS